MISVEVGSRLILGDISHNFSEDQELKRIEIFTRQHDIYRNLQPVLKQIAIDSAHFALKIPRKNLIEFASDIDTEVQLDEFGRYEQNRSGTILQRIESFTGISNMRSESTFNLNIDIVNLIRWSIGNTLCRIRLAREMSYIPGKEDELFTNKDFQAAQALCSRALQRILKARSSTSKNLSKTMKSKWKTDEGYREKLRRYRVSEDYRTRRQIASKRAWDEIWSNPNRQMKIRERLSASAKRRIERQGGPMSMALFKGKKHSTQFIAYKTKLRDEKGRFIGLT